MPDLRGLGFREIMVLSDLGEIEGEEVEWQSSVECRRGSWRDYSAGSQPKKKEHQDSLPRTPRRK